MKRYLSVLVLLTALCLIPALACASIAYPGVVQVRDASGQMISVRNNGDEHFSYTTDVDGYLLTRDESGYLRYVFSPDGQSLVLGDYVAPNARLRQSLGSSLRADAISNLQQKLSDLRADIAAAPSSFSANAALPALIPADYDPNDHPEDLLDGVWVAPFAANPYPERGSQCPLLVLKVEFSDVKCLFSDAEWNSRIFGARSVSEYYTEISNGQFTYIPATETAGTANDGVITVTLPITRPDYVGENVGQNYSNGARAGLYYSTDSSGTQYAIYHDCSLYAYAVTIASLNNDIDFSIYDRNGDRQISPTELAVLVVSAGYEAAYVGTEQETPQPMTWAHSWVANNVVRNADGTYSGTSGAVELNGVQLYKYTTVGENLEGLYDYSKRPSEQAAGVVRKQAPIGTPCHELGHDLGLMDLYDTTGTRGQTAEVLALSLMGSGNWGRVGNDPAGSTPVHMDAYSKAYLDFYEPVVVSQSGTYAMAAAGNPAQYNIIQVDTDDPDIYYLVENRAFVGFDAGIPTYNPGPSGLVFWRINAEVVRDKWDVNQINSEPGNYGIMPEYIRYVSFQDNMAFRNSSTYAIQPELKLESSAKSLACMDAPAETMNVWLLPLPLDLDLSTYTIGNAPDELLATLDTTVGVGLTPSDLRDVQMDGTLLRSEQYEVRQGSIVIVLKKAYLNTLSAGTHVLRATLKNGLSAEARLTVAASAPKTGDTALPMLWAGLALMAILGIIIVRRHKAKA